MFFKRGKIHLNVLPYPFLPFLPASIFGVEESRQTKIGLRQNSKLNSMIPFQYIVSITATSLSQVFQTAHTRVHTMSCIDSLFPIKISSVTARAAAEEEEGGESEGGSNGSFT